MAKVLAKVLQLRQNNEPEKANESLDEFGLNFLNIDLNKIIAIPEDQLINHLVENHQFELTHFKLLEDILYHKWQLTPSSSPLKNSTQTVLNYLNKTDTDFSFTRMSRITELNNYE